MDNEVYFDWLIKVTYHSVSPRIFFDNYRLKQFISHTMIKNMAVKEGTEYINRFSTTKFNLHSLCFMVRKYKWVPNLKPLVQFRMPMFDRLYTVVHFLGNSPGSIFRCIMESKTKTKIDGWTREINWCSEEKKASGIVYTNHQNHLDTLLGYNS